MATTVTKTIKSSGGDYTTVSAWEAGVQGNLVTADEVQVGEIYDVNTTAALTIDGSTTDATRYMKLTVNSAYRHAGKWDTGKQNMQISSTDGAVTLADPYTRLEYLQVKNTNAVAGSEIKIQETGCFVEQCVVAGTTSGGGGQRGIQCTSTGTNATIRNSVIHTNHYGIDVGAATGAVIENCATVANRHVGVNSNNAIAVTLRNHYSGSNVTANYYEGGSPNIGSWTFTNCMSSNTESTETGLTNSVAYNTTNFTNVTAGSEDLNLPSGSALIDAGADLSGTFTVDINGATRTGTWDVGPAEYIAAGGGGSPKLLPLLGVGGLIRLAVASQLSVPLNRRRFFKAVAAMFVKAAVLLILSMPSHAAVTLPFSTTYNCAENDQDSGNWPNCDGISAHGSWHTGLGAAEQITSAANYSSGGGGRGQRHWIGDGSNDGSGMLAFSFTSAPQELYVRWYFRHEAGLKLPTISGSHKLLYFGSPNDTYFLLSKTSVSIVVSGTGYTNSNTWGWNNLYGDGSELQPADGQWHWVELHVKRTSGNADGIVEAWFDGVKRLDRSDIPYGNAAFSGGFVDPAIPENGVFTTVGGADMYEDIDDIAMQTTGPIGCLACGGGGGSSTGGSMDVKQSHDLLLLTSH